MISPCGSASIPLWSPPPGWRLVHLGQDYHGNWSCEVTYEQPGRPFSFLLSIARGHPTAALALQEADDKIKRTETTLCYRTPHEVLTEHRDYNPEDLLQTLGLLEP